MLNSLLYYIICSNKNNIVSKYGYIWSVSESKNKLDFEYSKTGVYLSRCEVLGNSHRNRRKKLFFFACAECRVKFRLFFGNRSYTAHLKDRHFSEGPREHHEVLKNRIKYYREILSFMLQFF